MYTGTHTISANYRVNIFIGGTPLRVFIHGEEVINQCLSVICSLEELIVIEDLFLLRTERGLEDTRLILFSRMALETWTNFVPGFRTFTSKNS